MAFVITQPCIDTTDQSCVEVCPVDCIHFEAGADRMLYINPAECIDCGACQPACPVSAIFPEAEVPEAGRPFIELNARWYADPAGARAEVQSLAGSAPEAAAAAAAPAAAASPEAPASDGPATAAPAAAAAAPASAPAAARNAPARPVAEQLPARPIPVATSAGQPPHLKPLSLIALIGLATVFFLTLVVFPGPAVLAVADSCGEDAPRVCIEATAVDFEVGVSFLLGFPVMLLFLALFLRGEWRALASFAAHGGREVADWRLVRTEWRRSEEMRRFNLQRTVQGIATDRYGFPNHQHPELRTHVNLPNPSMALEFSGEKVFPDILVVEYPGNRPSMVVQVETRETLTREQAMYVWSRLENEQAPLDVYVPAGLASRAKDYAKAAGIKNIRFRTWRWHPNGMLVREV